MLKLNRPPQHNIDDPAEWIHPSDPAWNHGLVDIERESLAEQARGNNADPDEAKNKHPLAAWYRCETRYSQTAPLTLPVRLRERESDGTRSIDAYLIGKPTLWKIRPLGARAWRRVMAADKEVWPIEAVKYGLIRIEQPDEDPIEPTRDSTGAITEGWLDWLDSQDRTLMSLLGAAIFGLTQRDTGDEGKR